MTTSCFFHPSLILIFGALLIPLIRGPFRQPYLVLIPALTFVNVIYLGLNPGVYGQVDFLDWQLVFGRVDSLSNVFAFIMALMAIIGTISKTTGTAQLIQRVKLIDSPVVCS